MLQDLISRYKKAIRLQFQNWLLDSRYIEQQKKAAEKSAALAFSILLGLNLAFAYVEFRALGGEIQFAMIGYLCVALLALANLVISQINKALQWLTARLLACITISLSVVLCALYLQTYSAYHALEISLLLFWLVSLSLLPARITLPLSLLFCGLFLTVMRQTDASAALIEVALVLMICAIVTAAACAYLFARQRRSLLLQTIDHESMLERQENWAVSLVDLDAALDGVRELKEAMLLIAGLLKPVIKFDAYILTSLKGQGGKLIADEVDGKLFEDDDKTYWDQDLLEKLTQTRQAVISAEQKTQADFAGVKKQRLISYRLDVPVVSHSKLVGIISLRRTSNAFDDLDRIASESIATQAMLVFGRTVTSSNVVLANPARRPLKSSLDPSNRPKANLAPVTPIKEVQGQQKTAKKTITLLSRENADKLGAEQYRTSVTEKQPVSILVITVDGLPQFRKQHGDPIAYKVFASIVKYIFSKISKEKYIFGRYGVNGLSILMPKVDMNAAENFAEMIRQAIQSTHYKTAYGKKNFTLSIGVAAMTDDTGDYYSMLRRADMALFVAKKNGRNCVKVRL